MNVIVKGRSSKSFSYSFKFPCLDNVEASFKNGVLTVSINIIFKYFSYLLFCFWLVFIIIIIIIIIKNINKYGYP